MDCVRKIKVTRVNAQGRETTEKNILRESHIPLYVDGRKIFVFTCIGQDYEDMAVGYLCTEGYISGMEEVLSVEVQQEAIRVLLQKSGGNPKEREQGTSVFKAAEVMKWAEVFYSSSRLHEITGTSHRAMLFTEDGEHCYGADDISRHTAVDKAVGAALKDGADLGKTALMFSGRIPADIIHKVKNAGIPMLMARSNPTYEAIQDAEGNGIILCGNVTERGFTVYCKADRVV